MQKRQIIQSALCAVLAATGIMAAQAQQTFKLTIASSHPPAIPWVGLMSTVFVPEVNKRVAELGKGYKIEWREAYGGQLYKANATLTSVEQGVTDIGWVFHNLEAAKMPLAQFGTVTPFTTDDVRIILDVVNSMHETVPALKREWERNNAVFLGATGVDSKLFEHLKYYYDTQAWLPKNAVLVNKKAFDALDKPTQDAVLKAAAAAEVRGLAASKRVNTESIDKLKANGMQVLAPSAQLKADLKKVGDVMLKEWLEKAGPEGKALVDAYQR